MPPWLRDAGVGEPSGTRSVQGVWVGCQDGDQLWPVASSRSRCSAHQGQRGRCCTVAAHPAQPGIAKKE